FCAHCHTLGGGKCFPRKSSDDSSAPMTMNQPEIPSDTNAGDLPDIVDLVMEMGRTDEAPSPPLPAIGTRQPPLPAHLEKLAGRARDYVEAASSSNTRRAYASDWKHFASWCRQQGVEMLPPDP